jgi:hypothetical protein
MWDHLKMLFMKLEMGYFVSADDAQRHCNPKRLQP